VKIEDAGWLPAAACCVILAVALLAFMLTTSAAIPKALGLLRLLLDRFSRMIASLKAWNAK